MGGCEIDQSPLNRLLTESSFSMTKLNELRLSDDAMDYIAVSALAASRRSQAGTRVTSGQGA